MIVCSAGDFYGAPGAINESRSRIIAKMMSYLRYDAIGVGEMDLNYGLEKLLRDADEYGLNLTCANLIARQPHAKNPPEGTVAAKLQKKLGTVFPPYLVVERDGVKFGFVALLSPGTKTSKTGATEGEVTALTYVITDPWEIARTVVPEARGKCDVLILLAHMDRFDLEMNLPDIEGVDVVVMGHNSAASKTPEPVYVGTVPVFEATSKGQNIGDLTLVLDAEKNIVDSSNEIHFLGADVSDDKEVVAMIEAFDEENKKQLKILYAKEQLKASRSSGDRIENYLGVGSCMSCHPGAFEVYANTRHAQAYRTLSSQSLHRDVDCITCHTTGYGQKGGFAGVRQMGGRVDLIDVQCEACHGPGAEHSRDGLYSSNAVKSCERCHTKEEDSEFDYEKAWAKIAH